MAGARTRRRRAGATQTFIRSGFSSRTPCQSARSPVHPTAWLLASHTPHVCCRTAPRAFFPHRQPDPCRARWRIRLRLRLTLSFGSCSSGEWCMVPLCLHFCVLGREFFCVQAGALSLLSVGQFSLFCFILAEKRLLAANSGPQWSVEATPTGYLAKNATDLFQNICGDRV